jgi:hypothetical protein
VLWVSSVIIAFSLPLSLVSYGTVDRTLHYQRYTVDPASNNVTYYTFFEDSASSSDSARGQLSNFDAANPIIRFRPYVPQLCLDAANFYRHRDFVRYLNAPPLTSDQASKCRAEYGVQFKPPASCNSLAQPDCFVLNGLLQCSHAVEGVESQLFTDCYPKPGSASLYCCVDPETSTTDCTFVRYVTKPPECIPPAWTPPSYCTPPANNDPPFGVPRDATLWTVCPYSGISFDESKYCINYNCTGTVTVLINVTTAVVTPIVTSNILQGVGVDAAATFLDVLGTIFEHFLLPVAMKPIVLV